MDIVQPIAAPLANAPAAAAPNSSAHHIRGSGLLLVGRIFAQALEFGIQVLLVRYLSRADYGAFSYALAAVLLFRGFALFGMPDALSRYLPLYREHGRPGAQLGGIVLAVGVVVGLGLLIAAVVAGGLVVLHVQPTDDAQALRLLLILVLQIPVEGLDVLLTALFATFGSPRTIVLRQSLLGPGLRGAVVLALVLLRADVTFLALGYLAISLFGVLLYAWMFASLLRGQGLLGAARPRRLEYPAREIFGFALPLLASTLVWLLMESSDALLLGYFRGAEAVAGFRAVLPVARLNQGVILTFALLYTPLAARLYTRGEHAELSDLYAQTALWMTVLSFPIFVATFSCAHALTVGLFGADYDDSTLPLLLLSLGYFFHTALGFNGLTVKVFKRLRYAMAIDLAAAALNVAINLLLVPRWGASGAAVGTFGTMVVHNLLKQFGLWKYTGVRLLRPGYARVYAGLLLLALALLAAQAALPESLWSAMLCSGVAGALALWLSRAALRIDTIFPELRHWPLIRLLVKSSNI